MEWIRAFRELGSADVSVAGGKNASLGEMIRALAPIGVRVPDGFATTADAYRAFIRDAGLERAIDAAPRARSRKEDVEELETAKRARARAHPRRDAPARARRGDRGELRRPLERYGEDETDVAVRSSATAEDLPARASRARRSRSSTCADARAVVDRREEVLREPLHRARHRLPHRHGVRLAARRALRRRAEDGALGPRELRRHLHARHRDRPSRGRARHVELRSRRERRARSRRCRISSGCTRRRSPPASPARSGKQLGTKDVQLVYDESLHQRVRNERDAPTRMRARFSLSDDDVARARAMGGARSSATTGGTTRRWTSSGRRTAGAASCSSSKRGPRRSTRAGATTKLSDVHAPGAEPRARLRALAVGDADRAASVRVIDDRVADRPLPARRGPRHRARPTPTGSRS